MPKRLLQSLPSKILSLLVMALLTMLAIVGIRSALARSAPVETQVVGWAENIAIKGIESAVESKLDTGATTASINAEVIEKPDDNIESGGVVKFNFVDVDGNKTLFERPLERWVKIKGEEGRRPVVKMSLCMSGKWVEGEVNLSERDEFDYAVLVGRNLLEEGNLAVDSAQTFVAEPACRQTEADQ